MLFTPKCLECRDPCPQCLRHTYAQDIPSNFGMLSSQAIRIASGRWDRDKQLKYKSASYRTSECSKPTSRYPQQLIRVINCVSTSGSSKTRVTRLILSLFARNADPWFRFRAQSCSAPSNHSSLPFHSMDHCKHGRQKDYVTRGSVGPVNIARLHSFIHCSITSTR